MKTVENFKREFASIKNDINFLIEKLALKFTTEEILNFDSITFKDITIGVDLDNKQLSKQDYLILANESYDIFQHEEDGSMKTITKKTRSTLFSIKKSKILKMKEEEVFKILLDYTKLISLYDRYKLLRKELENLLSLNFPEIETWLRLMPIVGIEEGSKKIESLRTKSFNEYFELQNQLKREEKMIYQERSSFLESKLKR